VLNASGDLAATALVARYSLKEPAPNQQRIARGVAVTGR